MRFMPILLLVVMLLNACAATPTVNPVLPGIPDDNREESPVQIPTPTELPLDETVISPETGGSVTAPPANESPVDDQFSPRSGDDQLSRTTAFLNSAELVLLESYPVQVKLYLNGRLPTPCHKLRVAVDPPDKENRIYIDVYTLVDPAVMCLQVIKDFDTSVSLGTFPAGHYTVYVNNELIGEFDS